MGNKLNSMGFAKEPQDTRVVVAMSGGVDSSVTAALLHEEGYDVIGITLQLYDHGVAIERKGSCCAGQDIYDAKFVSEELGFPHYVLNYEDNFKEAVIDDFVETYLRGETPIPCVKCNQTVKFNDLLKAAKDLGADCMATGHYIKRVIDPNTGKASLERAIDHGKDQSYFLFATTQEQLDFLRFPLGVWTKKTTREHAERLGLKNAQKPDSQDICFVPNGDYASVVKKINPNTEKIGDILTLEGKVIGQHNGIIHYTIGQRKGLGIGGGVNDDNSPFYVIKIDASSNQVIVGDKQALARDIININQCNWLSDEINSEKMEIMLKFRSVMKPIPAFLEVSKDKATITLESPQYGIAPGQAAVCYLNDNVLGGGWITSTDNSQYI